MDYTGKPRSRMLIKSCDSPEMWRDRLIDPEMAKLDAAPPAAMLGTCSVCGLDRTLWPMAHKGDETCSTKCRKQLDEENANGVRLTGEGR